MFSSHALVQMTNGWFQVPSCDGLTNDPFIEDGRRSTAGGSDSWGTNCERHQSHGDKVCAPSKGWELAGKRYTAQCVSSIVDGDPLVVRHSLRMILLCCYLPRSARSNRGCHVSRSKDIARTEVLTCQMAGVQLIGRNETLVWLS